MTAAEAAATQSVPTATITANEAQTTVKVVISEPVLVTTAQLATAFSLNNSNADIGAVTASDPSGTPQVATTFSVAITKVGGLEVGDSFRLNANVIKNAAGTAVAAQTVVVAKDTTKPTATVLAAPNNAFFRVMFSEPVSPGANVAANYSAIGTAANNAVAPATVLAPTGVPSAVAGSNDMVWNVPVTRNLLPGDRVGINGGVIGDLVPAPDTNYANAVSLTVLADSIAPTLNGATVKISDTATAAVVIPGGGGDTTAITYVANTTNVPGVSGNYVKVEYIAATTNTSEVVKVITNLDGTKTVQVQLRAGAAGSNSTQVADAVNGDIFANALVKATPVLPSQTAAIGLVPPTLLANGATSITVVASYSEIVNHGNWNIFTGNAATTTNICSLLAASAAITPANGTSATYTATCSVALRPTAAAQLVDSGGTDLAGNTLAATAVTMTAAA